MFNGIHVVYSAVVWYAWSVYVLPSNAPQPLSLSASSFVGAQLLTFDLYSVWFLPPYSVSLQSVFGDPGKRQMKTMYYCYYYYYGTKGTVKMMTEEHE